MVHIVKDNKCYNCPLLQVSEQYEGKCKHPEIGNQGKSIGDYQNEIPLWCPLNKEPITIIKQ